MKNKSFFWLGICLSPIMLVLLWMLQSKTEPLSVVEAPQKSLLSIDFIPTKMKEIVPDKEFLFIPLNESEPTVKKKLTDFAGKPTIVHFWATWCGACVDEIPELDKFHEKYGDNFHLLVIASDETKGKAVREFYQEKKIKNLSIYVDEKSALARSLKIGALPTTVFVSAANKEQGRIVGPVEWVGEAGNLLNAQLSNTTKQN